MTSQFIVFTLLKCPETKSLKFQPHEKIVVLEYEYPPASYRTVTQCHLFMTYCVQN